MEPAFDRVRIDMELVGGRRAARLVAALEPNPDSGDLPALAAVYAALGDCPGAPALLERTPRNSPRRPPRGVASPCL